MPAECCTHLPLVHPAATRGRYSRASAVSTPSTGALGATLKGHPAAPSVYASAASLFGHRLTPLGLPPSLRTSLPSTVAQYATRITQRQSCRTARTAGRRFAAWPRSTHHLAVLHPAVAVAADIHLVLGLASGAGVLEIRPCVLPLLLWCSVISTMGIIPSTGSAASPCLPRASSNPSVRPRPQPSGVDTPGPHL